VEAGRFVASRVREPRDGNRHAGPGDDRGDFTRSFGVGSRTRSEAAEQPTETIGQLFIKKVAAGATAAEFPRGNIFEIAPYKLNSFIRLTNVYIEWKL
jgi:hypothetical protein